MGWAIAILLVIAATMAIWVSISKRVNRTSPAGLAMLAVANRYGFNRGTPADAEKFNEIFQWMTEALPGPGVPKQHEVGTLLARETAGSKFPIAVDAAWAAAALLPFDTLKDIAGLAGHQGYVKIASVFDAVFPGKQKSKVLDERVITKVMNRAVAGVLLITFGEEKGLINAGAL